MAYHIISGDGINIRGIEAKYTSEQNARGGREDHRDTEIREKPIYLLEHLATFTVNPESNIISPADGMRRLLQLEKTTGIWSQKMQLCLDGQSLFIMDYESGNVIERFPASFIHEPTAFTSTDSMELYNNILVFIINGGNESRSEMHIFQSQSASAVNLVEDLKNLRSGNMVSQQREPINASNFTHPGRNKSVPAINREQQQYHYHHHRNNLEHYGISSNGGTTGNSHLESDSDVVGINDETISNTSEKYERDVAVLNHCFDDIEKFIARLQHAAAASRELEQRQRNRKSKKKDIGEGLLTMRTRPPLEKEFIDIFAKFKLSFNLLAKLKTHIHDPNAPELVHFLFTPLALIVEASSDTYNDSYLPVRVTNPLLTREAINLLINCVTSKETELWRSLGDAWMIPRDQWKEHVGSYHPVFFDGWSPDYLVVDELEFTPNRVSASKRAPEIHNIGGFIGREVSPIIGSSAVVDNYGQNIGNSDGCNDSIPLNEKYKMLHQQPVVEYTADSKVNGITVDKPEDSNNHSILLTNPISQNEELLQTITSGLHNLNRRKSGSGKVIHQANQDFKTADTAHLESVPSNSGNRVLESWIEDLQQAGAKIVLVTYPRTANNDKELSVFRGEYLEILDDTRKWWKARNIRRQVGHVPHTIVTPYNYRDNEIGTHICGQQQHIDS